MSIVPIQLCILTQTLPVLPIGGG